MNLIEYYHPSSLSSARLDRYLAAGWFRSASMLFRSQLLCLDGEVYSPVNIRIKLKNYQFKKRFRKLLKQNKKKFKTIIRPMLIDDIKEKLYDLQKDKFKGFVIETLDEFMLSGSFFHSVFNTLEVAVYDQDKLVATSLFDIGKKSIASIIALYDPAYQKYSLGTYTMLCEIEYAIEKEKKFYYPGYVFDKPSSFDYKLKFDCLYYYNWEGKWRKMEHLKNEVHKAAIITEKMDLLKNAISEKTNIEYEEYLYPLFSLNYVDFTPDNLLRNPIFLQLTEDKNLEEKIIIEYDLLSESYRVVKVAISPEYKGLFHTSFKGDEVKIKYLLDIYHYREYLFKTQNIEKVLQEIQKI